MRAQKLRNAKVSPCVLRLAAVYPQNPAVVVEITLPPLQNLARSQSHRQRHHRAQSQPVLVLLKAGECCTHEAPSLINPQLRLPGAHFANHRDIYEGTLFDVLLCYGIRKHRLA